MTDPDDRRSRSRHATPPLLPIPIPPQPNFAALIPETYIPPIHRLPGAVSTTGLGPAINIPETRLPDNWNWPLQHPIPIVPPLPVPSVRGQGRP